MLEALPPTVSKNEIKHALTLSPGSDLFYYVDMIVEGVSVIWTTVKSAVLPVMVIRPLLRTV